MEVENSLRVFEELDDARKETALDDQVDRRMRLAAEDHAKSTEVLEHHRFVNALQPLRYRSDFVANVDVCLGDEGKVTYDSMKD